MNELKKIGFVLLFVTVILSTGCGGGDTTVQASNTTMGQELEDLDNAFKKGIITKREYEKAKEDILDRYNKY